MLKETIRTCIENYQKGLIEDLESELADKREAADIDEEDTIDTDTRSHQSQAQEEEHIVLSRLERSKLGLEYFRKIPYANTDRVSEGALIETENLLIYVGITTRPFSEDGRNIIGISTEAELYKTLEDRTTGFRFQFAGDDCEILSIN